MKVTVEVPPNTTATVRLPAATLDGVREAGQPLGASKGVAASKQNGRTVVLQVGSGRYEFSYPLEPASTGAAER